jgi:hypothetical protein
MRAEYVAAFCGLFPDLQIIRRPALIEKPKERAAIYQLCARIPD